MDIEKRNKMVMDVKPLLHLMANRFAKRFGLSDTETEEIHQTLMLKCLRWAEKYDDTTYQWTTYAGSCAEFYCHKAYADYVVRRAKNFSEYLDESDDEDMDIANSAISREGAPDSRQDAIEDKQRVRNALKQLKPQYRQVLVYRFYSDKTLQEIGDYLGITKQAVEQIEKKALEKLKIILKE